MPKPGRAPAGPPHDQVAELLRAYYRHVAPEDLLDRSDADIYGAFAAHYKLAATRPQGTAQVRVATPTLAEHGWSASGHSVVEVVVDDMPFLVDSLTMELSRQLRDVHVVIHPSFDVVRDITGALQSVGSVPDGALEPEGEAVRESWMHVEIDRLPEGDDPDAIVEDIQRVLRDVREAVEDWLKMHAEVDAIVADLRSDPPPLDAEEVRQAAELLEWLADEHFTFLGYREYKLEERDGDDFLLAVPGTGLGILRADQEMSESFGRLPDAVKAKAREKTLLVLAKANSRATVHRPAYLDYVGVKTFDANGEVDGERRFLGLLASAAYTESLMRIPLIREKTKEVLKRSGFDPRSHAGKALMDTLETYPRDELLHTPIDELAPMTEAAMNARERRAVRMFIRRDTYGRYVSVLVYLPRDRYNTGVRERFERILQEQLNGESIEFTVRINESTTARVHFVVHLPKGDQIPDVDTADLERRLTEASRSWRDDFTQAVIAEYGEEVGTILGRRYAESFPEAYKEDFSARTASVDLGRLEAIRTDGPHDGGLDLSLYEHLDAGPGEARLKVYRIGVPLSLSKVLPMLSSMGVEVVDERPYALEGLERESMIYEFGLRYGEHLPSGSRELFQDALRAVWDGYNEIDGFNGLVLVRRTDLAAGDRAPRRTRSTCGRATARSPRTTSRTRCAGTSTSPGSWSPSSRRGSTRPAARTRRRRRSSRSGSSPRSTTWPASTTTGSCAPTSPTSRPRCAPTTSSRLGPVKPARAGRTPTCRSSWTRRRSRTCRSRGPSSRSSSTHRGSRACTCGSAPWRAAACAGRTGATTSAPRCSAWSRRRW